MPTVLVVDDRAGTALDPDLAEAVVEPLGRTVTFDGRQIVVRTCDLGASGGSWEQRLADVGYVVARCRNQEREEEAAFASMMPLLAACQHLDVMVTIVFDRLTPAALRDVVLKYLCIDQQFEASSLGQLGLDKIQRVLTTPTLEGAHQIGSLQPMPADHRAYEEGRVIPLQSKQMHRFMMQLKGALALMDRLGDDGRHLRPPWDPSDRGPGWTEPEGDRWIWKEGPGKPNLRDVILAYDDPRARQWLDEQQRAAFEAAPSWELLPPKLLILGESGTGKSLVAKLVRQLLTQPPKDAEAPFQRISCGGLTSDNLDHVLFGVPPRVWTDIHAVIGQLTRAAHGVVFLDEIGDLPLPGQARLLTFLDDLNIEIEQMPPFFGFLQVIAATNRDLEERTLTGEFRHDLLARFKQRVELPPLRERREEIPQLVDFAAQQPDANPTGAGDRRAVTHISEAAIQRLRAQDYRQGNFRELEEVVHQGLHEARVRRDRVLDVEHLRFRTRVTYRSEIAEHFVEIGHADAEDVVDADHTVVRISDEDELRRLADRRSRPVLKGTNLTSSLVLFDGDRTYVHRPVGEEG